MTRSSLWIPLLAIALGSCPTAHGEPEPPSARFEHDMMVRFHMHENFDLLRAIEKLLIRGKLEEANTLARSIYTAPDEPGLAPWSKHLTRVRDLAGSLARSPTIDEALRREARVAVACAGCHVDAGVMPLWNSVASPPADKATIEARMARHLWATDRMWEGVVGGDPWSKGLDVLAATPLPFGSPSDDRAKLGRQLQQLAGAARKSKITDLAERGRVYGELLTVCATCHAVQPVTKLPSQR